MQQMAGKQESVRDCDVINANLVRSNKSKYKGQIA